MKAIIIEKQDDQQTTTLREVGDELLSAGDTLIEVEYSGLNYKDALAICHKPGVIRKWPMIPGIDLAGTVKSSDDSSFKPGDKVLLNGYGVGEVHTGGLAQQANVKSEWLVRLPKGIDAEQAMAIGTAGYTAMLCVLALEEQGITPETGEVLVTGAAGGVGSVAIAILAKLGYSITAVSGRQELKDYLQRLGAKTIVSRSDFEGKVKPLDKARFAGVVDVAGSTVLANAIAQTEYGGVVTACGLAAGMDLPTSVAPFILRGVKLIGIDSVMAPMSKRVEAWQRLARDLDLSLLKEMTHVIGMGDVKETAQHLLAGQLRGRTVVDVNRD
ncbi:hypothetical protein CWE21_12365 [Pseudidiomarina aquimaris]|uniref:Enoyl reductase (ER) domain-containing protein n=1 Tax=Pseudidiomarina aquimaris TaxID=641841 RepID=A0A432XBZ0_9GAMM|nr:MDR family oxidoreductase [Pseudidiomarina aquimaris]RUO46170.1 hypothetical protein CWE21_12365 [Pseudidiomarina aquimaris]